MNFEEEVELSGDIGRHFRPAVPDLAGKRPDGHVEGQNRKIQNHVLRSQQCLYERHSQRNRSCPQIRNRICKKDYVTHSTYATLLGYACRTS